MEVIGTPPGWTIDAVAPTSMAAGEIADLEYAVTTDDDSIAYAEVDLVVRTPEQATAVVRLGTHVRADVPKLEVSPTGISTAIVRGQQTLYKLIAHNVGYIRRFVVRHYPEVSEARWLCRMDGIKWQQYGHDGKALPSLLADFELEAKAALPALTNATAILLLIAQENPETGQSFLAELLES